MRIAITATQGEPAKQQEWTLEFRQKSDGSLARMLDLFKGDKRGILVFDAADGDFANGMVPTVQVIPGLDLNYVLNIGDKNDKETMSTITIKVAPKEFDSNKQVKDRLERYKTRILQVIKTLADLGNPGHSFEIRFYPDNKQATIEEFDWDGDGCDIIFTDDLKAEFKALEKL